MNIKVAEYESIKLAFDVLLKGDYLKDMPEDVVDVFDKATLAMIDVHKRYKANVEQTVKNITERRKTDKCYSRPISYKAKHKNEGGTTKYVIVVDYYCWSKKSGEYTQSMFLGLDGHVFVFDVKPSKRTVYFNYWSEAEEYLKKHSLVKSSCFKNGRVLEIY